MSDREPRTEALRAFFIERGWAIHMDDREGQPLDPFPAVVEALGEREAASGLDVDRLRLATAAEWLDPEDIDRIADRYDALPPTSAELREHLDRLGDRLEGSPADDR